jgi:hypothetical protein
MIILKNQYIVQRTRDVYIATISQFEASFDFSFAAQIINFKEKNAKRLNQRLQWQLNNFIRELRFVSLNQNQLKLMIFTDAAFANTSDLVDSSLLRGWYESLSTSSEHALNTIVMNWKWYDFLKLVRTKDLLIRISFRIQWVVSWSRAQHMISLDSSMID